VKTIVVKNYTVIIEPAEEGGFWAHVPALPGCFTQGPTMRNVAAMATEAIAGFIETLIALGRPVPRPF
jgi:predicted RNase H-like HicB family nuclease